LAALESQTIPAWMEQHGVRWQHSLAGTLGLRRTNRFFLGGGTALVNHYARVAEAKQIRLVFDAGVSDFIMAEEGRVDGVTLESTGGPLALRSRAVVVASGGFEANISWLRQYWHEAADGFVVRGTPYNDGAVLARLVDHGAAVVGDPYGFHAIAVDARAPRFDGGIATRVDAIPYGIVTNRRGHRFADEGADIWPKRYASWGGLIATQEGQIAFAVYDSRAAGLFLPTMYPPYVGATVVEVAGAAGLDADQLMLTVESFNAHAGSVERFDPDVLDGCATRNLAPPKSHWALPIEKPPYYIVPLRPGITFTFRGLAVNERAQVLGAGGQPFTNLYAAGEVMSGNILSTGYLAGFGLTIGTVFGRIAGREASLHSAR
jgi:tricarballylate dehydrogenase